MTEPRCFFEDWPGAGPCSGALIRAHLINQSYLKRTYPHGVVLEDGQWRRLGRHEDRYQLPYRSARDLCDDPRSWVPCCGGINGLGQHHGLFDSFRLHIPRERLPVGFVEFCLELGEGRYLDRVFGEERRAA